MTFSVPGVSMISTLVTCHWTGRRIQRYLDADPSAPLDAAEIARLEAHLDECERCASATREFRVLRGALGRWATPVDDEAVQRLRGLVDTLTKGEQK